MTRYRLRNNFHEKKSLQSKKMFNKQSIICTSTVKKADRSHLENFDLLSITVKHYTLGNIKSLSLIG